MPRNSIDFTRTRLVGFPNGDKIANSNRNSAKEIRSPIVIKFGDPAAACPWVRWAMSKTAMAHFLLIRTAQVPDGT
jgi:hypothetical protein